MRVSTYFVVVLVALILISDVIVARHIGRPRLNHHGHHHHASRDQGVVAKPAAFKVGRPVKHRNPETVQIAGSSLPDCSHACGSCRPCRLVMVSFVCATLSEAETCPMAYKCMCHNKSYPVP